jgi:hypothetical protein
MESDLVRRIAVARGDEPADLVLSGGRVLSVFTGELLETDVAVVGQHVAGVGAGYRGTERLDVSDLILLPGFIDGHIDGDAVAQVDEIGIARIPWVGQDHLIARIDERLEADILRLQAFVRQPSISAENHGIRECAAMIREYFEALSRLTERYELLRAPREIVQVTAHGP